MDAVSQQQDNKEQLRNELRHDFDGPASASPVFRIPLLLFDMFASAIRLLKPLAPQLIPLTVFALSIPIVVFFSLSAGWFVWRSIAVGWETAVHLQYGYVRPLRSFTSMLMASLLNNRDGPSPHAWITLSNLVTQQPYDVSVQLAVPASESNFALGNFMTTLTLATSSNKTIISVRRPVRF